MKVILPDRGEFGLRICYHVPAVHAMPGPKLVCCEIGERCLYPSADQIYEVPVQDDDLRRGRMERSVGFIDDLQAKIAAQFRKGIDDIEWINTTGNANLPKEYFIPETSLRFSATHFKNDVLICPRWRLYGANKNWHHWPALAGLLKDEDLTVFAAGEYLTSDQHVSEIVDDCTWLYSNVLEATIEAILNSRLVIATDAGLAHLAVLCGRPLLLITHGRGLVAPGPVLDDRGFAMEKEYWPIKVERFSGANHKGVEIGQLNDAWYEPGPVFAIAKDMLSGKSK